MGCIIITVYLFLAVLGTAYIATYTIIKGSSLLTRVFFTMSCCLSLYLFGYLMELNSFSLEQMYFWNQVQYLTLPFFPSLWLIVSILYTGNRKILQPAFVAVVFLIPVITFVTRLTNATHYLYYSAITLSTIKGFHIMQLDKGPLYILYSAYLAVVFFVTTYIYLKYTKHSAASALKQYKYILAAISLPYIGLLLIIIDNGRIGFDYAALLLPLSLYFLALAIFKYDFFKLKTLAREAVFEKSADAMILLSSDNILIDFNPAAANIFKSLNRSVIGEPFDSTFKNYYDFVHAYNNGVVNDLELTKGKYYQMKVIKTESYSQNTLGYLISLSDVTARNLARKKLILLATTDELTGLNNRRHFMELSRQEFERAKRYNEIFSLIMIDIDYFKGLNDTIGHAGGDFILRKFGLKLQTYFRSTDIAGRLGGEEFAVLLPQQDQEKAFHVAEKFREELARTKYIYESQEISFTVSLGIATYNQSVESFEQLIRFADQSLYEAKNRGRNCTIVCKL